MMEAHLCTTKHGEEVLFYEPHDANGYLSNFAQIPVEYNGVIWPTSEHAYQGQKFRSEATRSKILNAASPAEAFSLSREFTDEVSPDWAMQKEKVMGEVVFEKFRQNTPFIYLLLSTEDRVIKEHSSDSFWGDGGQNGSGENKLGKILMSTRAYFEAQPRFNKLRLSAKCTLNTREGDFEMFVFKESGTAKEHVVMVCGTIDRELPTLVRLHSECFTGDVISSLHCDCGPQLKHTLRLLQQKGSGMLLYLRQEGRGMGLTSKVLQYKLMRDTGIDTVEAAVRVSRGRPDQRSYAFCRGIFEFFSVNQVRLLTNNTKKIEALEDMGIQVERVPIQTGVCDTNIGYLKTKAAKMGHMFDENFLQNGAKAAQS